MKAIEKDFLNRTMYSNLSGREHSELHNAVMKFPDLYLALINEKISMKSFYKLLVKFSKNRNIKSVRRSIKKLREIIPYTRENKNEILDIFRFFDCSYLNCFLSPLMLSFIYYEFEIDNTEELDTFNGIYYNGCFSSFQYKNLKKFSPLLRFRLSENFQNEIMLDINLLGGFLNCDEIYANMNESLIDRSSLTTSFEMFLELNGIMI